MRSRPRIKLTLAPGAIFPGTEVVASLAVETRSQTPCDFVDLKIRGYEQMFTGAGNNRRATRRELGSFYVRHEPTMLEPGSRSFSGRFAIPEGVPGTFSGVECSIHWVCEAHVSIPWWPDRRESYTVPVRWRPQPLGEPTPQTFATNTDGPTGGAAYMEASLDRSEIVAGESVSGKLSLANVAGHKIREVRATILGIEHRDVTFASDQFATRLAAQIHQGDVEEGASIPFRLAFPAHIVPSFEVSMFRVHYQLELRAVVAWGSDVVLRIPIRVQPRDSNAIGRPREGHVAPVGRERRAVVWADVAARLGLENDPEQEQMRFRVGEVSLTIALTTRDTEMFVTGTVRWPHLGLDLTIGGREWTSLFGDHVEVLHPAASRKLTIHAREHAQAQAILGAPLLDTLVAIDDVHVNDDGATLSHRGNAQVRERLARIVAGYQAVVVAMAAALPRVPPPRAMAEHVPAWEAFATRLHGRLERGGMQIHGTWGTGPVEVAALWGPKGAPAGTRIAVLLDPPFTTDLASPEVSAAARAELQDIAASAKTHHSPSALAVLLPETVTDPEIAEAWLERLCRAARALRGQTSAGPFR